MSSIILHDVYFSSYDYMNVYPGFMSEPNGEPISGVAVQVIVVVQCNVVVSACIDIINSCYSIYNSLTHNCVISPTHCQFILGTDNLYYVK